MDVPLSENTDVPVQVRRQLIFFGKARNLGRRYVAFGLVVTFAGGLLVAHYLDYGPSKLVALAKTRSAYVKLVRTQQVMAIRVKNCKGSGNRLACYVRVDSLIVASYNAFGKAIQSIPMPAGNPVIAAKQLAEAAIQTGQAFSSSDHAHGLLQYEALVAGAPSRVDIT